MSTHPNDASRLKELEAFLPEARKYYVPAQEAQSPPRPDHPRQRRPRSPGGPGGRAVDSGPPISLVPV